MEQSEPKQNLPRLNRESYQGLATVHWIFNLDGRKKGWLSDQFLLQFRYLASHTFGRYQVLSPCLCLMPDHIHILLMGYSPKSDQNLAVRMLRKHLNSFLAPEYQLQKTPYDHVLRQEERKRNAFATAVGYILENPVRASLIETASDWNFSCCEIPGYPELNIFADDYWDRFWRVYYYLIEKNADK